MTYYFAVFIPVQEGGYAIEFPDFPEAISQGNDLVECMEMAADALATTVEEYAKARKEMPIPSTLEQTKVFARASLDEGPGVDNTRELLFQLFAAPEIDMTPVRINVSFPKSTLAVIDQKAHHLGMTRSGFLATAAQAYN